MIDRWAFCLIAAVHARVVGLDSLSIDELWAFRGKIATALTAKMVAEMRVLEDRLRQLPRGMLREIQPVT